MKLGAAMLKYSGRLRTLEGVRVLVVEDEYLLADDLAEALQTHGASVVGPLSTIAEATTSFEPGAIDCAVLDINLRGEKVFSFADRLTRAGVPFLFATGYSQEALPERFQALLRIEKPFLGDEVARAIPILLADRPERRRAN